MEETEEKLIVDITKEIDKLKYYAEQTDETIEEGDLNEIRTINSRTTAILDKLNGLVASVQELKIDRGETPRTVRQWKKEIKDKYSPWVEQISKLTEVYNGKQKEITDQKEQAKREAERELEERRQHELQQREREMWEEKFNAELRMTEKKMEIESKAKASLAKLPRLKITPFKGTAADWVRFENMFRTQVDARSISDEEKFGYLLESVIPKVRDRISNLKPSTTGYQKAWDRLKQEYGQTKLVINAHLDEIINLPTIKGSNYDKIQEFYDKLSNNFDALQTLGQGDKLQGFVMTTLNKLPHVRPDLVRVDNNWEDWSMEELITNLRAWLRRNKCDESSKPPTDLRRRDRNWFGRDEKKKPKCIYCEKEHWSDECKTLVKPVDRKKFFVEKNLCFNCGRTGHRGSDCRSRGCFKCGLRHHTSLCDKKQDPKRRTDPVLNGYGRFSEGKSLPAIVPVKVQEEEIWAYLDTGSTRNFISREAAKRLQLAPTHHETREIVTLNGVAKQSMPIYKIEINALDGRAREEIEVTGSKLPDFTTVKRPDIRELKLKYDHTKDKMFYMTESGNCQIDLIIGDKTFSRIRTETVCKGEQGDPIAEETSFGWIIHGGDDFDDDQGFFVRETSDCEKLFSLDVLGVEDRGDTNSEILNEFKENISRKENGRYEIGFPWIPGKKPLDTNEQQSRRRLYSVNRKLDKTPELKKEYDNIVKQQLSDGVVEEAPETPTGQRTYYMPHKPVVRQNATTTKVRMVFDASAKPSASDYCINDCMFTGPALQPHLWDILVRARLSQNLILADIQKAFLQIGVKEEDRDSFRFLYNINGIEKHLRFARVPFGAEASPFVLGATLQHHLENQPPEFESTVDALKKNTYVDNLMHGAEEIESLAKYKEQSCDILESAKFPVHKWESNVESLESDEVPNPTSFLGHLWDKRVDTLQITVPPFPKDEPVTKRSILSHLGSIYDPLGIISPTTADGKRIYREVCDEKKGWNTEVSPRLKYQWSKWTKQLRNVKIPRSINKNIRRMKAVHLHVFADASTLACCSAAIAVVEGTTGVVKALLASKSRISKRDTSIPRLELIGGHMAANMARNLCNALLGWPIKTVIIWMDSLVALFWINNPGKSWKTFVSNRVRKIAEITSELKITWKYCPTKSNLADLGSRGATTDKLEREEWFTGPSWLLNENEWPEQPELCKSKETLDEYKASEPVFFCEEREPDEWDDLLERSSYWRTLRITAWMLRFVDNCCHKSNRKTGPLNTDEIARARNKWVKRVQEKSQPDLRSPGWKLVKDPETGILRCKGRVKSYEPIYLSGGAFECKLIAHTHEQILHLGVSSTMAAIRETWWIPRLREKVKKTINKCNVCKVFAAKPFEAPTTSPMPEFRTEESKPFQVTGVDFAGPLHYKISKTEEGKCYVLIFTCAASRAVHLEVTKSQTVEEFQRKLNAFITRRTRPRLMISDNAATFKAAAEWIKVIRKSERLQNFLANKEIRWQFNLAKSPWWGGFYERLIKEVKKTLYKTLGRSHLSFEGMEDVIMDIERNLNNRPLVYVESEAESEVLTPNRIMWGSNAYTLEELDEDADELTKMSRRLKKAKQHAWSRWKREYIHALMETHRTNDSDGGDLPEIDEVVLIIGEEKNRGEWRKGRVIRLVKGADGVVRGVVLLQNGREIERPIQLVCPLEIKVKERVEGGQPVEERVDTVERQEPTRGIQRVQRSAAKEAERRIRLQAEEEADD